MTTNRTKTALKATGRGLVTVLAAIGEASALAEERKQQEIQKHVDSLKELKPGYDIMFIQKV
jgi:hypothetical protein